MRLHTLHNQLTTIPVFNIEFIIEEIKDFKQRNNINVPVDEILSYLDFCILDATFNQVGLTLSSECENLKEQKTCLDILFHYIQSNPYQLEVFLFYSYVY